MPLSGTNSEHTNMPIRISVSHCMPFRCQILSGTPAALSADEIAWVTLDALDQLPMGKLDRLVTRTIQGSIHPTK